MVMEHWERIVTGTQNPVHDKAMPISNVLPHRFEGLYLIGAEMEENWVGIGGDSLAKFGKDARLVGFVVCPKGLIGFARLGRDQHSKEIVV